MTSDGAGLLFGVVLWAIGLVVLWHIIRTAVLAALRQHHRETRGPDA